jgi:hypothetical protein
MSYDSNIKRCLDCEYARWVNGEPPKQVCKASEDFAEPRILAEQGLCPAGRFKWEGFGDAAAWLFHRLNLHLLSHWWGKLTGRKCGCAKRQTRWNKWGRRLFGLFRANQ